VEEDNDDFVPVEEVVETDPDLMTDDEYWEYCLGFDYDEDCSWYWDCTSIYEVDVCEENEGAYDNEAAEDEDDYDYGSESW